jgi:hypothetical protein
VTITIAPPVIPFRVDYTSGAITATYSSAPAAGRRITATYRYGNDGIAGALSSGAEHWMAMSVNGTLQGTRQRVLAVPFATRAAVADSVATISPEIKTSIQDLSNLMQRANISGTPMPGHFSDNTFAGQNNGINKTFVVTKATAKWTNNSYSSTIILNPPSSGFGSVGSWGWALAAATPVDAFITRITGSMRVTNGNYNSAEIRLVYDDGTYYSAGNYGSGAFDIANPNATKAVKTIQYWTGTSSSQSSGVDSINVVLYPVADQRRYVDIDLSDKDIQATAVTLITDALEPSRVSFKVTTGSWVSDEFSSGIENLLPSQAELTGLRIFLNYDQSSPTFSGASIQGYSLKYR